MTIIFVKIQFVGISIVLISGLFFGYFGDIKTQTLVPGIHGNGDCKRNKIYC